MKVKMKGLFILVLLFFPGWMAVGYIIGKTPASQNTKKKPQIFPESVTFNHDTECSTCDAINIRKNFQEDVHIPEWKKEENPYPAAYIKNKLVTVKAIFSAERGIEKASIRAVRSAGDLGNLEQRIVRFENCDSERCTSNPVCFPVSGETPGEIKSFIQVWCWYCSDINGSGSSEVHIERTSNKIFIVLTEPQPPWNTKGQTEPWSEALAWSCRWARGETTPEGAATKITKALLNTIGAKYDTRDGEPQFSEPFELTRFISNFPDVGVVNCYDMGKALVSFSNVVGCDLSYGACWPFGYVNCIKAIGRCWTNNPFYRREGVNPAPIVEKDSSQGSNCRSAFYAHFFGSKSGLVYDATLTVDIDDIPDYGPPHKEHWLIAQPWNLYKIKVIDKKPRTETGKLRTIQFDIE
jgi:hypothetical protein